jgi:sialate O-acetylesterase
MLKRFLRLSFALALPLLVAGGVLRADVGLPGLFSDNLVLQQGIPVPVWGWADDGETVKVTFRGQTAKTIARGGRWSLKLSRQKAGGPFAMLVEGRNRIELKNVLVGEVWVCSGQSNMEWPLARSFEAPSAVESSANSNLRLFTVPKLKADSPVDDVKASWQECNPDTARNFSAVAYFFGRDLQMARGVPVGLIHTSWGGSPAEVWVRHEVLAANPEYQRDILDAYPQQERNYREALTKWEKETEELKKQGQEQKAGRPWPAWKPSELYNGMIAPLLPYAIQGAIWYQGEGNASRAHQYRTLFPNLIQNWRDDWGQGNFSFLLVQLAPWDKDRHRAPEEITRKPEDSDWAELREAQLMTSKALPKVGLAVITDVGDKDDIHPTKKEPVGARLALLARSIADGEKLTCYGPLYKSMKVKKGQAILRFDHVGGGLESRGGRLRGFAIAGEDHKFVWAIAEIDGDQVVVSSPMVPHPVAVRYGWADYPVVNLFNREGLPASPFRTDEFDRAGTEKP